MHRSLRLWVCVAVLQPIPAPFISTTLDEIQGCHPSYLIRMERGNKRLARYDAADVLQVGGHSTKLQTHDQLITQALPYEPMY